MSITLPDYFVVMIDHGRLGPEAIIDPELTRRDVVARIADGNYRRNDILFVQHIIQGAIPVDVTDELLVEAEAVSYPEAA